MRTLSTSCAVALLASIGFSASALATDGTPTETGCPAPYEARTVADWEALDPRYKLPAAIDLAGNNDGIVCGRALPAGFTYGWAEQAFGIPSTEAPDVFYDFRDNNLPAQR
jgi:hypothetical protein